MQVSSGRGGVIFSIASETDYVLNSYIYQSDIRMRKTRSSQAITT